MFYFVNIMWLETNGYPNFILYSNNHKTCEREEQNIMVQSLVS